MINGELDKVRGRLVRIRFRNEQNHYTVADLQPGDVSEEFGSAPSSALVRPVTICGHMPQVHEGDRIEVSGRWANHPRYGRQLMVARYERIVPRTARGIAAYLASGVFPGVGEKTAARIVAEFGTDALEVIEHEPDRLTSIRGINQARSGRISRALIEHRASERVMLFLYEHGITPGTAGRIFRHYGEETVPVIQDNPYRLTDEVFGIGFVTADRIARSTGIPFHSPHRLQAAVRHVLTQAAFGDGHTFLPDDVLSQRVCELTNAAARNSDDVSEPVGPDEVADALARLERDHRIYRDDERVYLPALWTAETELANRLGELTCAGPPVVSGVDPAIERVERELGLAYAPEQRDAIRMALGRGVSIITGGPGTGKTTVIRGLIMTFDMLYGGKTLLACPTGRAARRLSEATGLPAATIHRLLGFRPDPGGGWTFDHDRDNQLAGQLLIIDETSMIDVLLAWDLVQAVPDGMRLVFVGDSDQLPSVGPGNVLRDLICSGEVPAVTLNTIFRQGERSGIALTAHAIREGRGPAREYRYEGEGLPEGEFAFIPREAPEEAARSVVDLAIELASSGVGVQVLAPMYRGACGVDALNASLQDSLNPGKKGLPEFRQGARLFRLGDRVMQIRNNYEKEVFNGDVGYVRSIAINPQPPRCELTVDFEGLPVTYRDDEIDELVLAYAVTVHKSQGSEFEAVICALVRQHYLMLRRNLLYTAVSRAKRRMLLVGDHRAVWAAIRNDEVIRRYTRLADRLSP